MMCDFEKEFEKEFADLLGEDISDIFSEPDLLADEPFKCVQNTLDGDFDLTAVTNTNVDLVLCLDVTVSMKPIIDTIKGIALNLYDDMVVTFAKKKKKSQQIQSEGYHIQKLLLRW